MSIRFRVRLSTEDSSFLCFKHAVIRAMKGERVTMEIESDTDSGNDMRSNYCKDCTTGNDVPEYTEEDDALVECETLIAKRARITSGNPEIT